MAPPLVWRGLSAKERVVRTHGCRRRRVVRRVLYAVALVLGGLAVAQSGTTSPEGAQSPLPYQPPRAGWLFVADSNDYGSTGRVLVVDPEEGRVPWSFESGRLPDVAVSPDGLRLYVASSLQVPPGSPLTGNPWAGMLEVIDTMTGIGRPVENNNRTVTTSHVYSSKMALSRDGRWLFQYKMELDVDRDYTTYYVDVFDTDVEVYVSGRAVVPLCGTAILVPGVAREEAAVLCAATADLRLLTLMDSGGTLDTRVRRLPVGIGPGHAHPSTLFLAQRMASVTVVTAEGRFLRTVDGMEWRDQGVIDRSARQVSAQNARRGAAPGPGGRSTQDWLAGSRISHQVPVLSPDGSELYLGVRSGAEDARWFSRIAVLDTESLRRVRSIEAPGPLASIALSRDGKLIYGVDTIGRRIVVIDAVTGRGLRTIEGVGTSPVFAVVAP
jgi:DNA-binding beta-propeller fold protein YncE